MASTINIIVSHFKKYWLIWGLNACAPILFIYAFGISNKVILGITLFEIIFVISFYYVTKNDEVNSVLKIIETENFLIIDGVFSKVEINRKDIKNVSVSKNFLSRIFDWSKIVVTTYHGKRTIYTKHINPPIID